MVLTVSIVEGNSTNPKVNTALAKAIENARKEGVAIATINGVIEKLEVRIHVKFFFSNNSSFFLIFRIQL